MNSLHFEMIEIGCLLFIAVYHIILYFQIRRKYYLYLGLLVFAVFIRALLVDDGSRILFDLVPGMTELVGRKIEYIAAYATLPLTPMFISELFKFRKFDKAVLFFKWAGAVLVTLVALTPNSFYKLTLDIYHVLMIGAFCLIFIILYQAVKKHLVGARYILYGVIVCFGFVMLEIMKNSRMTPYFDTDGPNLVNSGVLLYFFFQAIALSAIYARSFKENEKLNRELEGRVSARTIQLSKSNWVKERYIQIVSHDLRAPMGNLKTMLALVQDGTLTEDDTNKLIKKINKNLTGSLQMLDDLLEWTKVVSDSDLKIYKENVDLTKLIAETIPLFESIASAKGVSLKFRADNVESVEVDKNAIKVVLRNLINNAIKFTDKQDMVEIGFENEGDEVILFVSDTGIGIPENMKETIFDMDSKNKRTGTGDEKSTGIGLALSKDLVIQNGGRIWVEDNAPKGTVFKFAFKTSA